MPLQPGERLGPYEILAPIGAGGMGEVYRAHDTRLRRDVAIKVSAERFSERFEKEARAIASLNHPNVCTLHDVGPNYLVMELVEGETLAERIKQGAIPLDEALAIAKQVADALEAAQEKGITHRDLKPGNIIVKPDGGVKVLDFGLAKMGGIPTAQSDNSPTLTMGATQAGVILGTAAYMAPEQARGKEVDKRADIWAFGVVLYEMLTGQKLFRGDDLSHTLAAVIMQEPSLGGIPVRVRKLLRSCLQKDPKKRLRDIGDAWELLDDPQEPDTTAPSRLLGTGRRLGVGMEVLAAVMTLIAATTGFLWWRDTRPVEKPLMRLDVDLGSDVSLASPAGSSTVILSPDATRLGYIASAAGGGSSLFIRRFDQPKATELPGTHGASAPFFSPDGQWVGFFANGKLGKISIEGGAIVPLGNAGGSAGSSWGEDENVVHATVPRGLFRVPAAGGNLALLLETANVETALVAPQVLPGSKAVLFTVYTSAPNPDTNTIDVLSLPDRRRKTVVRGGTSARYLGASNGLGYLLYVNKATLFAVPFDPDKLETRGTALPILDDVGFHFGSFESQFDVSRNGTLVYRKAGREAAAQSTTIQLLDAAGKRQPLVAQPAGYAAAHLSPDGKQLAAEVRESGERDIQVYDLQRETWGKITFDHAVYYYPTWSPDSRYVVFGSLTGLLWARADGSGQPQPLSPGKQRQLWPSFSPDGKRVAYVEVGGQSSSLYQIWTVPLEQNGAGLKAGTPQQFLKSQFEDTHPAFSPDGKWLAYQSNSSGKYEVYVRAVPDNGGLWKISANGGTVPVWSRGAPELLYQAGDQIMAARYSVDGGAFVPNKSRVWAATAGGTLADLSQDGKRAVVLSPVDAPEAAKAEHEVVLIQNFLDELRRKVPMNGK